MKGMRRSLWRLFRGAGTGQPRSRFKLLVGLGNPGEHYAGTRHNVGRRCVDRLAEANSITFSQRRRHAEIGEGLIAGHPVVLAKARTFMNESGKAVQSLLARYRASPADLLVIYDDMDLPVGKLRLRARGSPGGHNGMRSVVDAIGTTGFPRMRIGIDRPSSAAEEVEHVLGVIPPEERGKIDEAVDRASQAVECMLTEGIDAAMDRVN